MTKGKAKMRAKGYQTSRDWRTSTEERILPEGNVLGGIELGKTKTTETPNMEAFDKLWRKWGRPEDSCWEWRGSYRGAAIFTPPVNVRHNTPALKWVFENTVGALPDGVVLYPKDNCTLSWMIPDGKRTPLRGRCVNPGHYLPMKPLDAYHKDFGGKSRSVCVNGHIYTNETVTYAVQSKAIFCKLCTPIYDKSRKKPLYPNGVEQALEASDADPPVEESPEVQTPLETPAEPPEEAPFNSQDFLQSLLPTEHAPWKIGVNAPMEATESDISSFLQKVEPNNNQCWVWKDRIRKKASKAQPNAKALPVFKPSYGPATDAHRWIFEVAYGMLRTQSVLVQQEGCDEHCVNPGHRILKSKAQFMRERPVVLPDHCPNGHKYTPENTGTSPKGHRKCLTCEAEAKRRKEEAAEVVQPIQKEVVAAMARIIYGPGVEFDLEALWELTEGKTPAEARAIITNEEAKLHLDPNRFLDESESPDDKPLEWEPDPDMVEAALAKASELDPEEMDARNSDWFRWAIGLKKPVKDWVRDMSETNYLDLERWLHETDEQAWSKRAGLTADVRYQMEAAYLERRARYQQAPGEGIQQSAHYQEWKKGIEERSSSPQFQGWVQEVEEKRQRRNDVEFRILPKLEELLDDDDFSAEEIAQMAQDLYGKTEEEVELIVRYMLKGVDHQIDVQKSEFPENKFALLADLKEIEASRVMVPFTVTALLPIGVVGGMLNKLMLDLQKEGAVDISLRG